MVVIFEKLHSVLRFQSLAVAEEKVDETQSFTQTIRYLWIVEFGIVMSIADGTENPVFLTPDDHPFVLKVQFQQENLAVRM